jgi:hypothetical protein
MRYAPIRTFVIPVSPALALAIGILLRLRYSHISPREKDHHRDSRRYKTADPSE